MATRIFRKIAIKIKFIMKIKLNKVSTYHLMTKNPKSIIWDSLTIYNIYMDIKGSFCREFKFLQHFITKYMYNFD